MNAAVLKFESLPMLEDTIEPDDEDLLMADDRLLVDEFRRRGVRAESISWRDPRMTSGEFDVVVLRSTWDYIEHLDEFLKVLQDAERAGARVVNPVDRIRWNSHKSYLFDLQSWGIPTVPTFDANSFDWTNCETGYVVKPFVGAGGKHVHRNSAGSIQETLQNSSERFIVQPFVNSVETEGEWSLVYFGGRFSHAMLKKPKSGDFRAHSIYGGTIDLAAPSRVDLAEADAIAERLPSDLAYFRLDLLRYEGRLCVLELELIEPVLYMKVVPESVERLGDAILGPSARF